jgi:DNA (cytosine-5)-methyltransferase 1
MNDGEEWKHIDLFSGIGGFALGARAADARFRTVQFVEWEENPQRILRKHFPETAIHSDIRNFSPKIKAKIVTGGFPCQPFSLAGAGLEDGRKGKEDERYLWREMLRVVKESDADWVVGENVPGIINLALDEVISDLENSGYEVRTFNIPAAAVGAHHRRHRVWIVARRICADTSSDWHALRRKYRFFQTSSGTWDYDRRGSSGDLRVQHAPTKVRRLGLAGKPRRSKYSKTGKNAKLGMDGVVNGLPSWLDLPEPRRIVRKTKEYSYKLNALRIHGLGNAIVPQVFYQIAKNIAQIEDIKEKIND